MTDFENIDLKQLIDGYLFENDIYTCVYCGKQFETGEIFQFGEHFFDARRSVQVHIESDHPDRLNELINSNSKYLSLTENQKELFSLFYSAMPDHEIAKKLGISASTVRHHKFMFREKAKAAKHYLAAWSMVEMNRNKQAELLPVHKGATMVDERYMITEEESISILENVFESLEPLKLKVFSAKEKKKIVTLRKLAEQFEFGKKYTEKEVNAILGAIYHDYATLRRYLIEYGYMERTSDCNTYWKK